MPTRRILRSVRKSETMAEDKEQVIIATEHGNRCEDDN
jgi:hypothetical protein